MSAHNLAEALRLAREWFNHEEAGVGPQAFEVIAAADAALAAHEAEQQAGEAVIYSISAQNHTEDAYATVQILNSAGKGYWELPMKAGTKLFTRPQQPLSLDQIIAATSKIDFTAAGWMVAVTRAIEAAHGITKDTK